MAGALPLPATDRCYSPAPWLLSPTTFHHCWQHVPGHGDARTRWLPSLRALLLPRYGPPHSTTGDADLLLPATQPTALHGRCCMAAVTTAMAAA